MLENIQVVKLSGSDWMLIKYLFDPTQVTQNTMMLPLLRYEGNANVYSYHLKYVSVLKYTFFLFK